MKPLPPQSIVLLDRWELFWPVRNNDDNAPSQYFPSEREKSKDEKMFQTKDVWSIYLFTIMWIMNERQELSE